MINTVSLINESDFKKIGQLSNSCDYNKLNIAIQEAQDFDLRELFCDWWDDFEQIFKGRDFNKDFSDDFNSYSLVFQFSKKELDVVEKAVIWDNLMNGGTYIGCNGKTRTHYGIKRIVAYYAYARYVTLNPFNDTPVGMKSKTNSFSIPIPMKELEAFSNKFRAMGHQSYKRTLDYLCHNKDIFNFTHKDCSGCECGGSCGERKVNTKGFGFRGKNISKYGS